MMKRFKRWIVLWACGGRRREWLSRDDIMGALAVSGNDPLYKAVRQLLAEQMEAAGEEMTAPERAERPGLMAHAAGGVEWLRQFDVFLESCREEALEKLKVESER